MFNSDKYKQAGQGIFMSSMMGLANLLALLATFLGAGPLYSKTKDWVYEFGVNNYGHASADIVTFVWGVICAGMIFFIARASISTALMFGAMALIVRFV